MVATPPVGAVVQQQFLPGLTMPAGHTLSDISNPDEAAQEVEKAYVEVRVV